MVSILPMVDLLGNTAVDWFCILSYFRLDTLPLPFYYYSSAVKTIVGVYINHTPQGLITNCPQTGHSTAIISFQLNLKRKSQTFLCTHLLLNQAQITLRLTMTLRTILGNSGKPNSCKFHNVLCSCIDTFSLVCTCT